MNFILRTLGLSVCLWTCHAVSSFASDKTFEEGGIYYRIVGNDVVVIAGANKYSGSVVIPSKVEYGGTEYPVTEIAGVPEDNSEDGAFQNCTGLTEIVLPNTLKGIGANAFDNCTGLTEIVVPEGVNKINSSAFYGCTGLTRITLPSTLTAIMSIAFIGCDNLLTLIMAGQSAPNLMDTRFKAFDDATFEKATLYVPVGCSSRYQASPIPFQMQWRNFQHIVEYGNIKDGEVYTQDFDIETKVRFTRNFKNTNWQSLYVPFSIPVDTLTAHGLTVAALNDTHQYDNNHDGVADSTKMEFFTLVSGETQPNYPYLIKANETGEVVFTLGKRLICAAAEISIECSSVTQRFTFVGTYNGVSGEEMFGNTYYAMAGGGLKRPDNSSVSLKPQRWYMKIENKDGSPVETYLAPSIRFSVDGMDEEETTSGIETRLSAEAEEDAYYSLEGSRLAGRPASGLSVRQGKIVLIRK